MSVVECKPLESLDELLLWTDFAVDRELVGAPLNTQFYPGGGAKQRPLTLVCHDMKGGYVEDRFAEGTVVKPPDDYAGTEPFSPFYVCHWWYMDVFVYFSHHFVTIPPRGWIDAAHKHGVRVLGTLITEWKDGAETCREMLKDEATAVQCARKLAAIACGYRFDGWLVNVENVIEMDQLPNLLVFVKTLTRLCKECVGEQALVIWYDSVIATSGRLKWQDELNPLNSPFFDACDGIFLNYGWTEASLRTTVNHASQSTELNKTPDNLSRVYVGVDCFGRGCLGGGGFNCIEAVNLIRKHNLSLALFAPGWTFEKQETGVDFTARLQKFWSLLKPGLTTRYVTTLPFRSDFATHLRLEYNTDQSNIFVDQCTTTYLLSRQALQPFLLGQNDNQLLSLRLDVFNRRSCYSVRCKDSLR